MERILADTWQAPYPVRAWRVAPRRKAGRAERHEACTPVSLGTNRGPQEHRIGAPRRAWGRGDGGAAPHVNGGLPVARTVVAKVSWRSIGGAAGHAIYGQKSRVNPKYQYFIFNMK